MARAEPQYESAPVKTAARAQPKKMNPIFLGILIGVFLGIGVALAVAVWMGRHAAPLTEKVRTTELPPAKPPRLDAPKADVAASNKADPKASAKADIKADIKATADPAKPRFEFYQILPGEKDAKDAKSSKSAKAETPKGSASAPTATAKPAAGDKSSPAAASGYVLQAGAFQSQSDAENLKAKIAFAGFEATVRAVNLPDKGTLYRVRIGPYKSLEEVNRIKSVLAENGITASTMKAE